MPNIRDVIEALGGRDGVDAVIILGRDGLPIDSSVADGMDAEGLSALVPSIVIACNRLGSNAGRGEFVNSLVEYDGGLVLISAITAETLLAIFVPAGTNVGSLLYELKRHRTAIAGLL